MRTFHAPFRATAPSDHARRALVQHHVVDRDGGLAPVVHDPVISDGLRHPAAAEVQVDTKFGRDGRIVDGVCSRRISRREDRDPRPRVDASPGPDDDPAAAREIDAPPLRS